MRLSLPGRRLRCIRSVQWIGFRSVMGKVGPITQQLQEEFLGIAHGLRPDRYSWLTQVNVNTSQPVPV